jgi:hypothetical protein
MSIFSRSPSPVPDVDFQTKRVNDSARRTAVHNKPPEHAKTDIREYVAELLIRTRGSDERAQAAVATLDELSHDTGFRGREIRGPLLRELATFESAFIQRIIVGQALPKLLSFIDESLKFVSPLASAELPQAELNRWHKIINSHFISLTFQAEWDETHLSQAKHAITLTNRLFLYHQDTEVLSEQQKKMLGNSLVKLVEYSSSQSELLNQSAHFAETMLGILSLISDLGVRDSAAALQNLFGRVNRIYSELSILDCDSSDYFNPKLDSTDSFDDQDHIDANSEDNYQRHDLEVLDQNPTQNGTNALSILDCDSSDYFEPSLDGEESLDDQDHIDPNSEDNYQHRDLEVLDQNPTQNGTVDNPEANCLNLDDEETDSPWLNNEFAEEDDFEDEQDVSDSDKANSIYHAIETLDIALLRFLSYDSIALKDTQFWHDIVYDNPFYYPAMPIALQGLAISSKESLKELLDPLLSTLCTHDVIAVQLIALLEIRDRLNEKHKIDIFDLIAEQIVSVPEQKRSSIITALEGNVAGDLSLINELSESILSEEEMSLLFGELLSTIYDRIDLLDDQDE